MSRIRIDTRSVASGTQMQVHVEIVHERLASECSSREIEDLEPGCAKHGLDRVLVSGTSGWINIVEDEVTPAQLTERAVEDALAKLAKLTYDARLMALQLGLVKS